MCVGLGGHGLDAVVAAVKKKGAGRTFTYARGALLQRVFAPPPLALGASHPTPCPRECAFRACTHTTRRYWGTARGGGGVRGCTPGANQLQLLLSTKHMRAQAAHGRPVLLERARPWSPRGRFWEPRTEARTARGLHHIHCMTLAQHCTPQLMPPLAWLARTAPKPAASGRRGVRNAPSHLRCAGHPRRARGGLLPLHTALVRAGRHHGAGRRGRLRGSRCAGARGEAGAGSPPLRPPPSTAASGARAARRGGLGASSVAPTQGLGRWTRRAPVAAVCAASEQGQARL